MDIVHKYFKCRTCYVRNRTDLLKILSESNPLCTDLSDDLQVQIKESSQNQNGSLVLVWQDPDAGNDAEKKLPISFTAWLGKVSLRPFVRVESRKFFLTMLDVDAKQIEEICAKIKLEDQQNSAKSLLTNPCYKNFSMESLDARRVKEEAEKNVMEVNE